MATKKSGQLTTSPEWARHLRPLLKRWFWKGERRAEVEVLDAEVSTAFIATVEELLAEVASWEEGVDRAVLHVATHLRLDGAPVATEVAMAIVLDAVLAQGFEPAGAVSRSEGTVYTYEPL